MAAGREVRGREPGGGGGRQTCDQGGLDPEEESSGGSLAGGRGDPASGSAAGGVWVAEVQRAGAVKQQRTATGKEQWLPAGKKTATARSTGGRENEMDRRMHELHVHKKN